MASSKFSVGLLLTSGLLVGGVVAACGGKEDPVKPGPTTAGTSAGGSSTGGSAVATSGSGGTATGGTTTGGSGGTATGMPPVGDKCGANSVKHPDGLCYCQPATLSACASGCGDFQTDADRCGNCDTKCGATQACRAGKCTTQPTVVVPAAAGCGSIKLTVAAGTLYWTDKMHGTVQSIATTGGTAKSLVTAQMAPTQIAVNGTALYWLASGSKSVMTATLDGATPTAVATSATADIAGFTFSEDGKTLYFSAGTVVSKTTAAPGGTPAEVGHEESGIPNALAVSGNLIAFPANLNGDVDIMNVVEGTPSVCASPDSQVATNSNCLRVARSQGNLYLDSVYIVENKAYWLNGTQVVSSPATGTPSNDTIATAANPNALNGTTMAIVNKQVYFADDVGSIYQAPLMINAPVATLARGQLSPSSITADDTNVYWANSDCSIMSAPLK